MIGFGRIYGKKLIKATLHDNFVKRDCCGLFCLFSVNHSSEALIVLV
jgi:hypothetical protein